MHGSHQGSLSPNQGIVIRAIQKSVLHDKGMKFNQIRMQHSLQDPISVLK
jgi:hypothetical protein